MSNVSLSPINWLEQYDQQAYQSFQGAISRTDSQLDPFITSVISAIQSWKTRYSVSELQDLLTTLYQGQILGVAYPKCNDLLNCEGFFNTIANTSNTFRWEVEYTVPEDPMQSPTITNGNLNYWAGAISRLTSETANVDAVKESVHTASSNHVYNSIFRPRSVEQIVIGSSPLDALFEVKGYLKLSTILNTSLPNPDYKDN